MWFREPITLLFAVYERRWGSGLMKEIHLPRPQCFLAKDDLSHASLSVWCGIPVYPARCEAPRLTLLQIRAGYESKYPSQLRPHPTSKPSRKRRSQCFQYLAVE